MKKKTGKLKRASQVQEMLNAPSFSYLVNYNVGSPISNHKNVSIYTKILFLPKMLACLHESYEVTDAHALSDLH